MGGTRAEARMGALGLVPAAVARADPAVPLLQVPARAAAALPAGAGRPVPPGSRGLRQAEPGRGGAAGDRRGAFAELLALDLELRADRRRLHRGGDPELSDQLPRLLGALGACAVIVVVDGTGDGGLSIVNSIRGEPVLGDLPLIAVTRGDARGDVATPLDRTAAPTLLRPSDDELVAALQVVQRRGALRARG